MSDTIVAIRCDGGATLGAGHVGRCLPIARALKQLALTPVLVGQFDGLAESLIRSAALPTVPPSPRWPAGIDPNTFAAALIDLYDCAPRELCEVAARLPIATVAESVRCETAGVLIDYHLDRDASETGPRLLAGPDYVPVDHRFALLAEERSNPQRDESVSTVLVTLGGARALHPLAEPVLSAVSDTFPSARLLVAGGLPIPAHVDAERLPPDGSLLGPMRRADVAVTAAGMTAYEMMCAGLPFLALLLADNQQRVAAGISSRHLGIVLDQRAGADPVQLRTRLSELGDWELRQRLSQAGARTVDGVGATRAAQGLARRWDLTVG